MGYIYSAKPNGQNWLLRYWMKLWYFSFSVTFLPCLYIMLTSSFVGSLFICSWDLASLHFCRCLSGEPFGIKESWGWQLCFILTGSLTKMTFEEKSCLFLGCGLVSMLQNFVLVFIPTFLQWSSMLIVLLLIVAALTNISNTSACTASFWSMQWLSLILPCFP